jgi:hypothetical protein
MLGNGLILDDLQQYNKYLVVACACDTCSFGHLGISI